MIFKYILIVFLIPILLSNQRPTERLPDAEEVKILMRKVCDYELANPHFADNWQHDILNSWIPSTFYPGLMATYRVLQEPKYLDAAKAWADTNRWSPAPRFRHADDLACCQTYFEIYELEQKDFMLKTAKARFDSIMADTMLGRDDWHWCDALYMAPPAWARLAKVTGNDNYYHYLHKQYFDAVEYLFDKEESLFYRDKKYFDKKSENGKKIFWSRGNSWVVAGIPRILDYLKADDVHRVKYEKLLQQMAKRLITLQGDDGLWRASLLDYDQFPMKESSGTAMFCFGMAWGINNGVLDRDTYLPVVLKAWNGLCNVVDEDGRVCYVQPGAASPEKFPERYTHTYAISAFLMAGEEIINLNK